MKFAVLISGFGSNLQAIIDACKTGEIKSELAMVISSKSTAEGLKRAEAVGIKTSIVNPKDYTNTQSVDRDMAISLKQENVDFICLAGYMRILTPFFIKEFPNQIINVHPSLLPAFKGKQGIKDAFTYGVKTTGVTMHIVTDKMDAGPIILQESVKIQESDTLETLEEKIHKLEHRLYPKAIQLYEEGRIKIKGRKVHILDKP